MIRYIAAFLTLVAVAVAAPAREKSDTVLHARYTRLFSSSSPDSAQAFYDLSEELKYKARKSGDMPHYYELLMNEISYEASRGRHITAIRKAYSIMDDIQHDNHVGTEYYSHVFRSLGSIYEHRGNYQMSNYYYERALNHLEADKRAKLTAEQHNLIGNLYASLARVNLYYAVNQSWYWNEQLGRKYSDDPHFLKPYLSHKARLHFYRHQIDSFLIVKHQFDSLIHSPNAPQYGYGERRLDLMEDAVTGHIDRALWAIDSIVRRDPMTLNAAMRIHDAIGRKDLALEDAYKWVHMQDSLNSELVNNNLSELNVMLGTDKVQRKAARERERWMLAIIILFALVVLLVVARYITRNRHMRQIEQKNAELERALDEAQESERMKISFVQHISHEMRTPLNIITGNAQLIANPDFELDTEDRNRLLQAIDQNTVAMTNIINDLLEMSFTDSKGHYHRDEAVTVNTVGRHSLEEKEAKNNGRLELKFASTLEDDFTIDSNFGAIERILVQLLGNALKFTEHGSVELAIRRTDDGGSIEFAITDTGIGVPEEYHEQIFEHFYKVDQFKQGMGIGLSMARKVAGKLGGTLTIDSNYTDGARFVLTIPIS